jgi:hypothetical protein
MAIVREAWTDERLDDLTAGMHREFDQVHTEIRAVREEFGSEIRDVRGEIRGLRAHTDAGFEAINARFDALNRTLMVAAASIVASVLGAVLVNGL